jgi:hypothetical protein
MFFQTINEVKAEFEKIQEDEAIQGILFFGCDKNSPEISELEASLASNHKPLLGGIFPEIIAGGIRKDTGFIVVPLFEELEVVHFQSSESHPSIETQIENFTKNRNAEIGSVFCFLNALWSHKQSFLNALYNQIGPFVQYVGGGAGSLSFKSFPCVFCNQNVFEHAAVIGVIKKPIAIGVAHGWEPISDAIKVTEAVGNSIVSLNWKPAFEVYQAWVEKHSKLKIGPDNFFDIAKSYPLGLIRIDDEMIIRDPYVVENGMLHIVDEVPENTYIRIMHGNMNSLLNGARKAMELSSQKIQSKNTLFCIDCISRVLYMQDNFEEELVILNQIDRINGILSIGEIANAGHAALEIYNKTVVVVQWKKTN